MVAPLCIWCCLAPPRLGVSGLVTELHTAYSITLAYLWCQRHRYLRAIPKPSKPKPDARVLQGFTMSNDSQEYFSCEVDQWQRLGPPSPWFHLGM